MTVRRAGVAARIASAPCQRGVYRWWRIQPGSGMEAASTAAMMIASAAMVASMSAEAAGDLLELGGDVLALAWRGAVEGVG